MYLIVPAWIVLIDVPAHSSTVPEWTADDDASDTVNMSCHQTL